MEPTTEPAASADDRWSHIEHEARAAEHYNFPSFFFGFAKAERQAFRGRILRVGQPAPPFRLPTVDGGVADLGELNAAGKYVAVIFGSGSVGPTVRDMPDIDVFAGGQDGTNRTVLFVYTREAHPNEPTDAPPHRVIPHHTSMDEKVAQARAFRDELGLSLPVCVDDLVGTTVRAYGGLPFFQVVVAPDGTLLHRCDWADLDLLGAVFANIERSDRWTAEGRPQYWRGTAYCETLWLR